jgi:tRNA uridine 5-carboxymethylaminomethyl modification enzyme
LREDNADLRLTEQGRKLGLVDDARWAFFTAKRAGVATEMERLAAAVVPHDGLDANLRAKLQGAPPQGARALDLLRRPEITYDDLAGLWPDAALAPGAAGSAWRGDERLAEGVKFQVEVQAKYAGYLKRQDEEIERGRRHETLRLPPDLDYSEVTGLSNEARQQLAAVRPETLGMAARIPGLTPAAVSLLLVHLKRRARAA